MGGPSGTRLPVSAVAALLTKVLVLRTVFLILILILIFLFSQLPKLLTIGSYPQTGRAAMQVLPKLLLQFPMLLVHQIHINTSCFNQEACFNLHWRIRDETQ